MQRWSVVLTTTAVAAAVLIIAALDLTQLLTLEPAEIGGVAVIILLGVVSEAFGIDNVLGRSRNVNTSIAFVPLFTCGLLFAPAVAAAAAVVTEAISYFGIRRLPLWKSLFNTAQTVIAISTASVVLALLQPHYWESSSIGFLPFTAFVVTAFTINVVLVAVALIVTKGTPFWKNVRQIAGTGGSNLLYGILASPLAFITAVLYKQLNIAGLILIILPLLLVRYSYRTQLRLEQANEDLLRVLIKAIETRDPYTSGHSIRVATLARAISEDLGLSSRKIEEIENAALLHDIGKIDSVYASIIQKPAELSQEELRIVRLHAAKGANILHSLSSFGEAIIAGVRHHHERYDGNGYPDGLSGHNIPLPARVIMLCDSIDAMLSDRPYRRALTVAQVQEELVAHSGTQFDPDIVATILRRHTLERAAGLVNADSAAADEHGPALQLA